MHILEFKIYEGKKKKRIMKMKGTREKIATKSRRKCHRSCHRLKCDHIIFLLGIWYMLNNNGRYKIVIMGLNEKN